MAKGATAKTSTASGLPVWAKAGITKPGMERYLYGTLPERDAVLQEMEQDAAQRKIPIVGPAVARVLYLLAKSIGAKRIFEMGSAIGYSTVWWARAVGEGGNVVYTDGDPKNAERARRNFERAGVASRITIKVGDALEILSEQNREPFDIIFNDVDKEAYPRVFRLAPARVRRGGLFITDNVLWNGRVADPKPDSTTKIILDFNRLVMNSPEFFTTILPIRDGLAVALKL